MGRRYIYYSQFCSPASCLGGPGRLRMTSCARWDFSTIASFRRTAVCILRTFPVSLKRLWFSWLIRPKGKYIFHTNSFMMNMWWEAKIVIGKWKYIIIFLSHLRQYISIKISCALLHPVISTYSSLYIMFDHKAKSVNRLLYMVFSCDYESKVFHDLSVCAVQIFLKQFIRIRLRMVVPSL